MLCLSTIIPIKNVREYIEESLATVISQSLDNREIILVDDGSTDGSDEYAKSLSEQYEWITFIQTDELGPGGARNAGIKLAKGKYINFADADDIVPENSYKKMYEEAERTSVDCVIGRAVRLSDETEKIQRSWLHDKVYSEYHHITNIKEYSYLIYDTTLWNKMIRRDFWERNAIIFPEKTPYQDIPATFKVHYYSEKVSMIDDVVYIWRIRKGENRSLTQKRFQVDNLNARINMLSIVDRFINEKVNEKSIIEAKESKWLIADLRPFMIEVINMEDPEAFKMINILREYIIETGLDKALDKLPIILNEQYKALIAGNIERLRALRMYETEQLHNIPTRWKRGQLIGVVPHEVIGLGIAQLSTTVSQEQLSQKVTKVECSTQGFAVYGYAYLHYQPVASRFDIKLRAFIINTNGDCIKELRVKRHGSEIAAKRGKDSNGKTICNYYGAGYTIFIDRATIESLETGSYHIRIVWKSHDQKRDTTVKGLSIKQIDKLNNAVISLDNKRRAVITTTLRNEPEIIIYGNN